VLFWRFLSVRGQSELIVIKLSQHIFCIYQNSPNSITL
jgi:hypothetical protein